MSPRRSSRARSSNANPAPPSQTASSTSTSTLKHTRSNQRSESIENPPEDSESQATEPVMQPRRSRRTVGDDLSKENTQERKHEEEADVDEEGIEEEITRCICGQTDYPGPSDTLRQIVKGQPLESLGDELGSFFVCCDNCSVWQHGGCVGLTNEDTLPDEYYCERCKPDQHKLIRGSNGSKASLYRPVVEADTSSRSPSTSSDQRKNSKGSKSSEPAKRRATMNSRGAYDEDEMLRRAIEESKHQGAGSLGKRPREDGDDSKQAVKRQRTSSSASTSDKGRSVSPGTADPSARSKSHLRGVVARNNKEKEIRDRARADAAAAKAEAANRRNARSERRRGEDSPPPTPSLSPSKAPHSKTKPMSAPKDSTPPFSSHPKKKTAASRVTAGRRGRLGRNQYTRERDLDSETPMRDASHDRNGIDHSPNGIHSDVNGNGGNGKSNGLFAGSGKQSKAKTHPARTSLNEMKRRVAAILEFVGQMQTKANTGTSNSGKDTPNSNGSGKGQSLAVAGLVKAVQAATEEVNEATENGTERKAVGGGNEAGENGKIKLRDDGEFRTLGSVDMMETLTKELVGWQNVYGVWSK